jgi:hypothetical protein
MLSYKRLIGLIAIVLFVSIGFFLINFQESTHEEITIENKQFAIQTLNDAGETIENETQFVLVSSDFENEIYLNMKQQLDAWGKANLSTDQLKNFDIKKEIVYIFCEDEIRKTTDMEALVGYVEQGGTVFFAAGIAEGNAETYLHPILGITNKSYKVVGSSFLLSDGFLPFQEEEMKYNGFSSSTWIQLREKATIYVKDIENGEPVIYSYSYGEGKSLVVNATFLEEKNCMGMVAGLLSNEIEGFIYPVYNAELFFLDNFPVVTYVEDEICLALFGRTTDDFVENVIWPVFQRVAIKDEIKFTSSVMTMISGDPFFPELETALFYTMGKSALVYDGELIGAADYSKEGVIIRNDSFYDSFSKFFPAYQIQALAISNGKYRENESESFKVIRGYMFGDSETMFICEPGVENNVYQFPVITDGFTLDEGNAFTIAMQIAVKGVLSQRVDINTLIVDEDENPVWDQEKILFAEYQERIMDSIDWLDSITLSETGNYIHGYDSLQYKVSIQEEQINLHCSNYREGQSFYLHLPYEIEEVVGANIEKLNGNYYLIQVLQDDVELIFED